MTDQMKEPKLANKPAYIAYAVPATQNKKPFWTPVGAVFAHADGKGYTVQAAAWPVDGRLVLRVPTEQKPGAEMTDEFMS